MRVRRLQVGCNINERNVEASLVRNLGDTPQTHIHGSRNIWQLTRSWNYVEQEVAAKTYRYRKHQRTGHHCHDRGKPPTHQTDECVLCPLGICGPPLWKMYRTIEKHTTNCENYIPIVGGDFNAKLGLGYGTECSSVGKHTPNGGNKREEIGWNIGWWYKISQHSTRCTERLMENKGLTDLLMETRRKSTTAKTREDTWNTTKMQKPTTWSTCVVTTDVSWQLSWSLLRKGMAVVK